MAPSTSWQGEVLHGSSMDSYLRRAKARILSPLATGCQCASVAVSGSLRVGAWNTCGLWEGVLTNLNGRTAGGSESGDAGANDRCSHRWLARPIDHVLDHG